MPLGSLASFHIRASKIWSVGAIGDSCSDCGFARVSKMSLLMNSAMTTVQADGADDQAVMVRRSLDRIDHSGMVERVEHHGLHVEHGRLADLAELGEPLLAEAEDQSAGRTIGTGRGEGLADGLEECVDLVSGTRTGSWMGVGLFSLVEHDHERATGLALDGQPGRSKVERVGAGSQSDPERPEQPLLGGSRA